MHASTFEAIADPKYILSAASPKSILMKLAKSTAQGGNLTFGVVSQGSGTD